MADDKPRPLLGCAILLGFLLAAPAAAQTGQYALNKCEAYLADVELERAGKIPRGKVQDRYDTGWCVGYTTGLLDMVQFDSRTSAWACPPEGFTYEQAIRMAVKYWRERPGELHLAALWGYIMPLGEAFPCEQAKPAEAPKPAEKL